MFSDRHLDKFEGFSLWVSQNNNKYEESLSFAKTLADQLMASGLKFTTHHDELTNTAKYGRIAPLVESEEFMMPLIISRCYMNHVCRPCFLRPE